MQYLKGSKHSQKIKRQVFEQLIQVNCPRNPYISIAKDQPIARSESRSLHRESERVHTKQSTTITQSKQRNRN